MVDFIPTGFAGEPGSKTVPERPCLGATRLRQNGFAPGWQIGSRQVCPIKLGKPDCGPFAFRSRSGGF